MTSFLKDPNAVLDYRVDWSGWLPDGDTIVASSWTVPDGITEATPPPSFDDTSATIWLSGGAVGQSYTLVNRVQTAQGRQDDCALTFVIRER